MRTQGKIKKWDDNRGFGFIVELTDTTEIFVHISAFYRDGVRPKIGEFVYFDIELDEQGNKRAINVQRTREIKSRAIKTHKKNDSSQLHNILLIVAIFGIIGYIFSLTRADNRSHFISENLKPETTFNKQFSCDGRQHCSQMHSRQEAEYFIQNCPNTKMDGDSDGIPCENDTRF